jgi:hypothetical protein
LEAEGELSVYMPIRRNSDTMSEHVQEATAHQLYQHGTERHFHETSMYDGDDSVVPIPPSLQVLAGRSTNCDRCLSNTIS